MNPKDIKHKVEDLIASGVPKSVVFRRLSGGDVKDRTLAYLIAARIDPRRCEANKWRIRFLVMVAYVEVAFSFLVCLGIGMKISPLVGLALAIVGALFSFLFAWGFQRNKAAAYNAFMILTIGQAPNQLNNFSHASIGSFVGLAISFALYMYVWSLRKRLFPDFAFMSPRKVDGAYVFDD
ncbi:hypothetical protein SAMN05414139_07573 [Burkholderia sp. D7]|nr:hypothetical protein SAMN05414139_07573 [Burkholderia sp. D7]